MNESLLLTYLRNGSIRMNAMLQTIQLPDKWHYDGIMGLINLFYQQALPICTPAWPIWMEMTSLMLTEEMWQSWLIPEEVAQS